MTRFEPKPVLKQHFQSISNVRLLRVFALPVIENWVYISKFTSTRSNMLIMFRLNTPRLFVVFYSFNKIILFRSHKKKLLRC
jgi:hypothetical protein